KLQYTVTTKSTIKIKTTKIAIKAPAAAKDNLEVGKSYRFGYTVTPANSTAKNVWTVTDSNGLDCSSYMSSTGIFKPALPGVYTIKIQSMIDSKVIKSASVKVEVVDYLISVKQPAANQLLLTYSGNVSEVFSKDNFQVKNEAGASIVIKDVTFSADGKEATLNLYSTLKDQTTYTISDGINKMTRKASVGVPVKMQILTKQVVVEKSTEIKYALYDSEGVDVSSVYPGRIEFIPEPMVTNGYVDKGTQKLFMKTVGGTATISLRYTSNADSSRILTASETITCISASTSDQTAFTITTSKTAPDFEASSFKENRKAAIGNTYYAHFRALDSDKSEIKYSKVNYQSSDPDTLIISSTGKITPIKSGKVQIIVTATYGGDQFAYCYEVTIAEASYLKAAVLDKNYLLMSNAYSSEYCGYINVTAIDQYGESFSMTNESATFTNTSTMKASMVSYHAADNRIVVNASNVTPGTYSYTMTLTSGDKKVTADFTVVVQAVPVSGTNTYEIQIDKSKMDLSLNSDIAESQYATVRLAQYRDGVFAAYSSFVSATITKDGYYYNTDLTVAGTTTSQALGASTSLKIKTLDITQNTARKAETGTYIIEVKYYSTQDRGYQTQTITLTLTDIQDETEVRVERTTSSVTCWTGLELARNCLSLDSGTIEECEITGETLAGSKIAITSGDQINIKYVTVKREYTISGGQTVSTVYRKYVGKTLTNK
ncbi:MAG: hypothetical protein PUD20_05525, partial [bacterium]|nr:hypothetical protein [bacterium]